MTQLNIGYFVGSLATNSINRTLSKALIKLAPDNLQFTEIPIKDLGNSSSRSSKYSS